jgi:tRNA threonylcarbamoyl adenosine modification protein YeaZ
VYVLGIDTSSPAVSVALVAGEPPDPPPGIRPGESRMVAGRGPSLVGERTEVAANRHGELLAPLVAEAMKETAVTPADLVAIGIGLGPGPFTGLRVGIVTAKAMADALHIPVYGECSLDVIAHDLSGTSLQYDDEAEPAYAVLTDARRKQVYWGTYGFTGGRIDGPEISTPEDVAARLSGEIGYLGGAGALLYRDVFKEFIVYEKSPYPSAATIAERAWRRCLLRNSSDDLKPLYLRRPDAKPPGAPKKVTPV